MEQFSGNVISMNFTHNKLRSCSHLQCLLPSPLFTRL